MSLSHEWKSTTSYLLVGDDADMHTVLLMCYVWIACVLMVVNLVSEELIITVGASLRQL